MRYLGEYIVTYFWNSALILLALYLGFILGGEARDYQQRWRVLFAAAVCFLVALLFIAAWWATLQ